MKKLLFILLVASFIFSCSQKNEPDQPNFDQAKSLFVDYISAYTSGVISAQSNVKIKLAKSVDEIKSGTELGSDIFQFEPKLKGKTYWEDDRTIIFQPEQKLTSGANYTVTFRLAKILPESKDKGEFKFGFRTIPQNFEVKMLGMALYDAQDLTKVKLTGQVQTADNVESTQVEQILSARQGSSNLTISWAHESPTRHAFVIENVQRGEAKSEVQVTWDGQAIQVDETNDLKYEIPSINDYKVLSVNIGRGKQDYISVLFSDPLMPKQNLKGFITLGNSEPRIVIDQNELKLYPTTEMEGTVKLKVFSKIKNSAGYTLKEDFTKELELTQAKPDVRMAVNSGTIIPNSEGLIIPFEAVGLKAVDVTVVQIFEDNVLQYLQVNSMGDDYQLNRVGRPIARKTINLLETGVTDLNEWNRYTLDIAEFTKVQPGAMYQIKLSFRKSQSAYFCPNAEEGELEALDNWDNQEESSNWDGYENYYSSNNYDWRERENPCSDSYYMYRSTPSKLVLASDLGLVAKKSDHGDLHVFITNMLDTQPLSDVSLAVYDYQQQAIGSAITNKDGQAKVKVKGKPFLLVAKSGEQMGYLKIDDGSSLSLSNFNVTGQKIQKGVKGFIYGERGVWRPGDDIFLTFILEDKESVLPKGYPIVLELNNPQGQLVKKVVKTEATSGMYSFQLKTNNDAPTGRWQAVLKAGGATFSKSLKIETIKPNRLKIELDFKKERLTALDENISGDLSVKWLHGATAGGLKAEYEMIVSPVKTTFIDYPNFKFDDESKYFYAERQEVFSGRLDANGFAKVNLSLNVENNPPGALKATFSGKVYEEGGNFSIDQVSIPYYPYTSFVGLKAPEGDKRGMLLTDEEHNIRVVSVDAKGQPVSRRNVEVELYKLDWRWWWDNSYDNIGNYVGRSYNTPLQSTTINTSNGEGNWDLKIDYPDWGRYYVKVTDPISGHSAGQVVYVDWPGWAGKGARGDAGGVSMLNFEVEKEKYQVGDLIKLTFPSAKGGRVLVSLETGKKVIQTFWVETEEKNTAVQFEATADMSPNVYVHISMIQPHAQTANDLPIRMYGIQSVEVIDPNTILKPQLAMPKELNPEQTFQVKVSEQNGRAMAYSVAMVDDGILDLTRYKTPSPWESFYAREALGVKTWDIYDDVIGAYGGKLERLLAIGGDGELKAPDAKKANRFKPVVKYLGPFFLKAGETAAHEITMPQYVGSVRTMVVAAHEGAYGAVDQTTAVKQSVMVLATLPRVAGPGEEMDLPVTLFVNDDKIKQVTVSIKEEGKLKVVGEKAQTVKFSKAGEQVVYFRLKAAEALGFAKVNVTAKGGNITAQHDIELDVRASNPEVVDVASKLIGASESWSAAYAPLGMKGTNGGLIELSSLPSLNLEQRLQYLIRYPHGCIEQTTSSVFAQLYLDEFMYLTEERKQKISTNIKAAIQRLNSFQTANGGMAYWPGGVEENDWGTNYAGHFLLEAKKKGYAVPEGLLSQWMKYQKRQANQWSKGGRRDNDLIQAYRLYTLALADEKAMGAMNRMKEMNNISNVAKWRLALAYALAGYQGPAETMIDGLTKTVEDYKGPSYTYGSRLRDRAMILETLAVLNRKEEAYPILDEIAQRMGDQKQWMSTQTTAYSLVAIAAYTKGAELNESMEFDVNVGSAVASFQKGKYVTQIQIDENEKSQPVVIKNKGNAPLYARLIRTGVPLVGQEQTGAQNIKMTVSYKDQKGNALSVSNLKQSTNFTAQVTVHHPGVRGEYRDLALTQIFPSGWEIINTRLNDIPGANTGDQPDYLDIRDDRAMQYFDLKPNEKKTFEIKLNASYKGKFYLPAVAIEAMYDNSIYARTSGQWVNVVE
ncbi:MG2 domain-containing protein [Reichenbachiella carrageenanivorans]|uniref:MG2 domain-containing protein n=1 Tax=Reichenbachiella carrageenanivorans TaxID=2979869 RepID=A0ABY6D2Y6_9BACT|nr:MG2 domain-containing protein [Reichenbachiella carrageenanivorans]UXX80516.1 MG2 domain-containing protein [Reichenbachiella carrageenanivorans]